MKRRGAIAGAIIVAVICAAAGVLAVARRTSLNPSDDDTPMARVRQGDLEMEVYGTGELRAEHSMPLIAPTIGGGTLQITKILHTGTSVRKGDVVIEFDPREQHYKLEQSRSELLQADQEITKAKADAVVQTAQDKVDLLKAQFAVRRAELDVQGNELVSAIEGRKNQLALDQAKRALAQLQEDLKSHSASGQASIYLSQEKRNKAKLSMDQAQENIDKMRVLSPMEGLIAIEKNTGVMDTGWRVASLPDYHEGDQAGSGSNVAQVVDPREMEVSCKIGEHDRSNVKVGQPAQVEFDALPGQNLQGSVKTVGGMSTRGFFFEGDSGGQFDVTIQLSNADPRLRPGLTAQVVILGDKRKNVLSVPRQAMFLKDGKRIVYVRKGSAFEQREVKVQGENESRTAIENLKAGTEVALVDPTVPRKSSDSGKSESSGGGTP